jgi:hypothetical protein
MPKVSRVQRTKQLIKVFTQHWYLRRELQEQWQAAIRQQGAQDDSDGAGQPSAATILLPELIPLEPDISHSGSNSSALSDTSDWSLDDSDDSHDTTSGSEGDANEMAQIPPSHPSYSLSTESDNDLNAGYDANDEWDSCSEFDSNRATTNYVLKELKSMYSH